MKYPKKSEEGKAFYSLRQDPERINTYTRNYEQTDRNNLDEGISTDRNFTRPMTVENIAITS